MMDTTCRNHRACVIIEDQRPPLDDSLSLNFHGVNFEGIRSSSGSHINEL